MSLLTIISRLCGKEPPLAAEQVEEAYATALAEITPLATELVTAKKHIDREYINFSTKKIYHTFGRLHPGFKSLWREFKQAKREFLAISKKIKKPFKHFINLWQQKTNLLLTKNHLVAKVEQAACIKNLLQIEIDLINLHGDLLKPNILNYYTLKNINSGPPQDPSLHATIANYAPKQFKAVRKIEMQIDTSIMEYLTQQHFHAEPEQLLVAILPEYLPAYLHEKYKKMAEKLFWQTALTNSKQPANNIAHACIWAVMQYDWYKHGTIERIAKENPETGLVEWHEIHLDLAHDQIHNINLCVDKLVTCFHNLDLDKIRQVKLDLDHNLLELFIKATTKMDNKSAKQFLQEKMSPEEFANIFKQPSL